MGWILVEASTTCWAKTFSVVADDTSHNMGTRQWQGEGWESHYNQYYVKGE